MIFLIEGEQLEWSDKLLVTDQFDPNQFIAIMTQHLGHYSCGITLWCYENNEIELAKTCLNEVDITQFIAEISNHLNEELKA